MNNKDYNYEYLSLMIIIRNHQGVLRDKKHIIDRIIDHSLSHDEINSQLQSTARRHTNQQCSGTPNMAAIQEIQDKLNKLGKHVFEGLRQSPTRFVKVIIEALEKRSQSAYVRFGITGGHCRRKARLSQLSDRD